jgi:hypothetical protein
MDTQENIKLGRRQSSRRHRDASQVHDYHNKNSCVVAAGGETALKYRKQLLVAQHCGECPLWVASSMGRRNTF